MFQEYCTRLYLHSKHLSFFLYRQCIGETPYACSNKGPKCARVDVNRKTRKQTVLGKIMMLSTGPPSFPQIAGKALPKLLSLWVPLHLLDLSSPLGEPPLIALLRINIKLPLMTTTSEPRTTFLVFSRDMGQFSQLSGLYWEIAAAPIPVLTTVYASLCESLI